MNIFICVFKYYQGTLGAILYYCWNPRGVPGDSVVKNPPASARDVGLIPGWGRPPRKGNGNGILAWEIPWTREPGGLQSLGSQESWTWLSD